MRIVRHPNIVELKAFYYSNGDRVCANDSWSSAMILSSFLSFSLSPSPSLSLSFVSSLLFAIFHPATAISLTPSFPPQER